MRTKRVPICNSELRRRISVLTVAITSRLLCHNPNRLDMNTMKMKAVIATAYGGPDVLEIQEVDRPQPAENEVLVQVFATVATTADTMMRTGKPYFGRLFLGLLRPKQAIMGTGFAGVVEQVGDRVTGFKLGDRVFGETTTSFGANAEYVAVAEDGVILKMPDGLPFSEAAAFCDGHLTSFNFLKRIADIQPGQKILINGAAGSLGTAAVQLAKYYGGHVTGVCSGRNTGLVKSLGADKVIDYTKVDFTQINEQYDVIYDSVGKSSFMKSKQVLAKNGLYLSPVLSLPLLLWMLLNPVLGGRKAKFEATGLLSDSELRKLLIGVAELYRIGRLRTVIDRQYPLEKTPEAHGYISGGHKKGNVVIMVRP